MELVFKYPFASDNVRPGARNKEPCVVVEKSLVLIHHGLALMRIGAGAPIGFRCRRGDRVSGREVKFFNGHNKA